jgi:hypothetical protein
MEGTDNLEAQVIDGSSNEIYRNNDNANIFYSVAFNPVF